MSETKKDTGVGSYFVSNYPPYSFWKNEHQNTALQTINTPAQQNRNLGFYMHIPFCRKRCKFCYFRVYTDKNKKQREDYLHNLVKELELYAKSPAVRERAVKFFYVGGGTPSALAHEQIEYLGQELRRIFPHENVEEVTFECEPGTLSEKN